MISATSTVKQLLVDLDRRAISSHEVVDYFVNRIALLNNKINVFVASFGDSALESASLSDKTRAQENRPGMLGGIPFAVKDILCTREGVTTCGSRILSNYVSPFDAHVVSSLKSAGAILIGKTNLDEFAMGGSTETSLFGPSFNPWDFSRTCGGSSGGSAAAVAAGLVPLAIGTDTGGSIRQPAAFCGVCGLKPTYGRLSRYGLIAYASSLDQAGLFARTVEDLAIGLTAIAGHDPKDSTSINRDGEDYVAALKPMASMRIGIIREHLEHAGLNREIRQSIQEAINVYRSLGATIVDISMPHAEYAIPTYYIIAPCEASSNLARFDGAHYGYRAPKRNDERSPLSAMYDDSRSEGFGTEVRRRILLGTYALSAGYYDAYYLKALRVRRLIRQDYDRAFEQVDVLLGPTTPSTAFKLGEKVNDPVQLYLEDLFTVSSNLAGVPAMSIPIGFASDGLPIGLQLQSKPLNEATLLAIGHAFQKAVSYRPTLPTSFSTE